MAQSDYPIATLVEDTTTIVDAVVFSALAFAGVVSWIRTRSAVSGWFAGMFLSLAFVVLVGFVAGELDPGSLLARVNIAVLALMPFCLYRFTRSFTRGTSWIDVASSLLTLVVVGFSLALVLPEEGDDFTGIALAFLIVFVGHWALLSLASAWYFFREARITQGVAGRRMRLFAGAALVLAAALLLAGVSSGSEERSNAGVALGAAIQVSGAVSAILFWFAMVPPRWLRMAWRAAEMDDVQGGLRDMLSGETVELVHERALTSARRLTGGAGAILLDEQDQPIAWQGVDEESARRISRQEAQRRAGNAPNVSWAERRMLAADRLIVASGAAAPFFGADEMRLLETISAFVTVAESRASTLERERQANERLRQVDQLKTEFVAMVAHDLRSPMSVITGFADTIHDRWDDLSDADKLAYLRLISRNTRSLAEFVEDVLQVARMESGELHYEVQPFDARTVVQRIVTDMQLAHPELKLSIDAPEQLPPALGDEERNWQILTNLVSNAMKFSGGDPRIRLVVSSLPDESAVSIAVCDHGVGISEEDLPRLFRRFSRVGASRQVAGTGLGLYIVKEMVEAQGGRIWVDSTPGEGSTFTYTLPVASGGNVA